MCTKVTAVLTDNVELHEPLWFIEPKDHGSFMQLVCGLGGWWFFCISLTQLMCCMSRLQCTHHKFGHMLLWLMQFCKRLTVHQMPHESPLI